MSYKWPDKDPDETVDYSVDWSRFLGDDSIVAATLFVKDDSGAKVQLDIAEVVEGLQLAAKTISGAVVTGVFALGTLNKRYTIVCRINTASGYQYERSIFLRVKEK
jgi:hypothetical protein